MLIMFNSSQIFNQDQDGSMNVDTTREAQQAVSESIARNLVKEFIVNSTIITRPILHAIHGGKDSTNFERLVCSLHKREDYSDYRFLMCLNFQWISKKIPKNK